MTEPKTKQDDTDLVAAMATDLVAYLRRVHDVPTEIILATLHAQSIALIAAELGPKMAVEAAEGAAGRVREVWSLTDADADLMAAECKGSA